MDNLLAGRLQMAVSLGFHIIFACIGMAMPFLMAVAEYRWIKTGRESFRQLAKMWAKGVAIFFATGAVSGTMLSFELGLLWPTFMEHAGPIFGMPFSWEGTAFFVEAIALGLFLYGWDRLNKWVHFGSGIVVGISGVASAIFVLSANSWMNSPAGFDWVNGQAINVDPVAAMFNDAWLLQALHMVIASFVATGFAVAGLHAILYLKNKEYSIHKEAMKIALTIGAIAAILQPLSGDLSAKQTAELQPAKLAAMESLFETEKAADLLIGGIPDEENEEVKHAIKIPGMLSFLAHGDFNAEVTGLNEFPKDEWPPVAITHYAFQIMVGCGMILAAIGILFFLFRWKWPKNLSKRWFLIVLGIASPLGFIAIEAGWTVTEVGRQPWIIYGIMKTQDAISPMPGLDKTFYIITTAYLLLTAILVFLMKRLIDHFHTTLPKSDRL